MSAVAQTPLLDSVAVTISSMVKFSGQVSSSVWEKLFVVGILSVTLIFEMVMPCDLVTFFEVVKLSEQVKVCVKGTPFEAMPGARVTLSLEMKLFVKGILSGQESFCSLGRCLYDQEKPCDWGMFFDLVTILMLVTCGTGSFALRGFFSGSSSVVKGFPSSAWTVSGLDWRRPAEPFQRVLSCLGEESHPFPFLYDDHHENEHALDFFPPYQPCGLEKTFVNVFCCCSPGSC